MLGVRLLSTTLILEKKWLQYDLIILLFVIWFFALAWFLGYNIKGELVPVETKFRHQIFNKPYAGPC